MCFQHVTFPKPTAVVLTAATPHLHLAVSSDCTVKVTNLRNQISSRVEPMVHLYNKVADNHTANLEPCISAKAINGQVYAITVQKMTILQYEVRILLLK